MTAPENPIPLGTYRHYKGNHYEVIGFARHSETLEDMVIYKALYGDGAAWVRPLSMWDNPIEVDGKIVKRFAFVGMNVELFPALPADVEALAVIQKRAFRGLYEQYQDEGSPYLRGADEILRWLERPNWHVFKIHADGALCGGIAVCQRPKPRGEFYLARIYISPELRGRGIAPAAIALCEARFPRARHWTLDFPADQAANRRCYEKAGYVDTSARREQSGGTITLAIYEKKAPPTPHPPAPAA